MSEVILQEQVSDKELKDGSNETEAHRATPEKGGLQNLVEEITSNQEQGKTLAQKENIYDERGNIIDVRFTQNGNTETLKNILPGDYTIVFTHYSSEELRAKSGIGNSCRVGSCGAMPVAVADRDASGIASLLDKGVRTTHFKGLVRLFLEFGDFRIAELFLLNLKYLLEQRHHPGVFA